ncbi:MAG TPA: hypothetical protein VNK23_12585 [Candidatus Dormibacteraeota bacterium]|nr:hypothetical protein [Candidatus Dormibacteraeota bacterium]
METKTLPDGYLDVCSIEALESLELARLNKAANLRGEMKEVLSRWMEAEVDAKLARWMLEKRRSQQFRAGGTARLALGQAGLGSSTRALLPPAPHPRAAPAPLAPPAQTALVRSIRDSGTAAAVASRVSRPTKTPRPERPPAIPGDAAATTVHTSSTLDDPPSRSAHTFRETGDLLPADDAILALGVTPAARAHHHAGALPQIRRLAKVLPARARRG